MAIVRIWYIVGTRSATMRDYTWDYGAVSIFLAMEPALAIITGCLPSMLPLVGWARDKARSLLGLGACSSSAPATPGAGFHGQWAPTLRYAENGMVLRLREDDEMRLTTLVTRVSRNGSEESLRGGLGSITGIAVRSELVQTVEKVCPGDEKLEEQGGPPTSDASSAASCAGGRN